MTNPDAGDAMTIVLYDDTAAADAYVQNPQREQAVKHFTDLIQGEMTLKEYDVGFHMTV
jgi:hypothetical protein